MYRGTLIPIGGNEDKGQEEESEHEFVTEGILSQVVKESGGEDALISIVPTASMFPKSVGKNYKKAFKKPKNQQFSTGTFDLC